MLDITKQLVGIFLSNNYSRNFGKFPGNIFSGGLRIQDTVTDYSWKFSERLLKSYFSEPSWTAASWIFFRG